MKYNWGTEGRVKKGGGRNQRILCSCGKGFEGEFEWYFHWWDEMWKKILNPNSKIAYIHWKWRNQHRIVCYLKEKGD